MSDFIKIALDFLKNKIGKTGTLLIGFFVLGIFFATSYSKYIVTPDTLQQTEEKLNIKVDKITAKAKIEIIEIQLDNLRREKTELEDKIDVPKPKSRHKQRLKEVSKRIDTLEINKKASMDILEK